MMGVNSFLAMDRACDRGPHWTWNHDSRCQAPQPHEPEASEVNSVMGRWDGGGRNDTPFQRVRNSRHQARSALNSAGSVFWSEGVVHGVQQVNHLPQE